MDPFDSGDADYGPQDLVVAGYVPVEDVREFIKQHGGEALRVQPSRFE